MKKTNILEEKGNYLKIHQMFGARNVLREVFTGIMHEFIENTPNICDKKAVKSAVRTG